MTSLRILCLGTPHRAHAEFEKLKSVNFVHCVEICSRPRQVELIQKAVDEHGPFHACLFCPQNINNWPKPYDLDLFRPMLSHLKFVAAPAAGYDWVDVDGLAKAGIWYANSPYAPTVRTADATIMMILMALRGATANELNARAGKWQLPVSTSKDSNGMTLGMIGMGAVGSRVAQVMRDVFGMRIQYNKRTQLDTSKSGPMEFVPFEQLLQTSDVLCVMCPLTPETRGLLGPKEFEMMKKDVILINTARGEIVQEQALIDALASGKVLRAALDVFENEPNIRPELLENPNVTIQPHTAFLTDNIWLSIEREVMGNFDAWKTTGVPNTPVNDPRKAQNGTH